VTVGHPDLLVADRLPARALPGLADEVDAERFVVHHRDAPVRRDQHLVSTRERGTCAKAHRDVPATTPATDLGRALRHLPPRQRVPLARSTVPADHRHRVGRLRPLLGHAERRAFHIHPALRVRRGRHASADHDHATALASATAGRRHIEVDEPADGRVRVDEQHAVIQHVDDGRRIVRQREETQRHAVFTRARAFTSELGPGSRPQVHDLDDLVPRVDGHHAPVAEFANAGDLGEWFRKLGVGPGQRPRGDVLRERRGGERQRTGEEDQSVSHWGEGKRT
jgi:hypothetical protein